MTGHGQVRFFYGPMDCGKSTLALQIHQNQVRQGRRGLLLTRLDRSGPARISSRIGISSPALEVTDDLELDLVVRQAGPLNYVVVDEAQFLTSAQVDQLGLVADDLAVDVYAFGIATDFRSVLFPGSARLFEIADEVARVQVEVLCWCGRVARFNGRVVDGRLARHGPTVLVADTASDLDPGTEEDPESGAGRSRYQVLCRRHYRSGQLAPNPARPPDV
ncbi:MAG TPA: thymidine kinase [Nakamurella sp.]